MSTGLHVPDELNNVPRTIFGDQDSARHYDQIAWFTSEREQLLTLEYANSAGTFDFIKYALTEMTAQEVSWRLSDHYPLWVEFGIRQRVS